MFLLSKVFKALLVVQYNWDIVLCWCYATFWKINSTTSKQSLDYHQRWKKVADCTCLYDKPIQIKVAKHVDTSYCLMKCEDYFPKAWDIYSMPSFQLCNVPLSKQMAEDAERRAEAYRSSPTEFFGCLKESNTENYPVADAVALLEGQQYLL